MKSLSCSSLTAATRSALIPCLWKFMVWGIFVNAMAVGVVCADDNQKGPSSEDLEEETLISQGLHPRISYVDMGTTDDMKTSSLEDLRVRYRSVDDGGRARNSIYEYHDAPRYFTVLPDKMVEKEVEYRVEFDRWSDRVVLEKLYFGLAWGRSGFPEKYYDLNQKKQDVNEESGIDGSKEVGKGDVPDLEAVDGWDIFQRDDKHCEWTGISCNRNGQITEIKLDNYDLQGTVTLDIQHLSNLEFIDLKGNAIQGSIPSVFGRLTNLKFLCLAANRLEGTIPKSFAKLTSLEKIWLSGNSLTGSLPENLIRHWPKLRLVDLSNNKFQGTFPHSYATENPSITNLFLERNNLTGTLPEDTSGLQMLQILDLGRNQISGTIPSSWMGLTNLKDFNVAGNRLTGSIPTEILQLSNLSVLVLSDNHLTGTIPRGDLIPPGTKNKKGEITQCEGRWSNFTKMSVVMLNNNKLSGILPPEFLYGSSASMANLDIGKNNFTGSFPDGIGQLKNLQRFSAQQNRFTGKLPPDMNRMKPNLELNLTGNLLTGTVPRLFCGGGAMSRNILYRQFGCDVVLCPPGTFHPHGAATIFGGCRSCPASEADEAHNPPLNRIMGRLDCPGVEFAFGDLDGDGKVSQREVLRLLWSYTLGVYWGPQFQTWADPSVDACDLNGVVCVNGNVAKLDLTDAALCSNGDRKQGPIDKCGGLPTELALLSDLEILSLNRRQFLYGTIPTEFGRLTKLKYLDLAICPNLIGTIPTELGRLTNLKFLNLGGCRFSGTVPDSLFRLTNLEKLHLSMNSFSGTISPKLRKLTKLKELMWSRTQLSGSIPPEIGQLTLLENLEMYGNQFTGNIPSSLGDCKNLKRIDFFNNQFTGSLPETLTNLNALQILHLKMNRLTGTISSGFGELPFLSWIDVSSNQLHGTIPESFGSSRSIKDFRLGGNMIYDPIPPSLCTNTNINGGLTRMYGCDGVICPLGTYSDPGHATHSDGCKSCPEGTTTLYLGSSSCEDFTEADILAIFFNVMGGSSWHAMQRNHWKDPEGDVCEWQGIKCDGDGEISSIRFPLLGLDDPQSL